MKTLRVVCALFWLGCGWCAGDAVCIRTQEHFFKLIDMGIDRMGIGYKSTAKVLGLDK